MTPTPGRVLRLLLLCLVVALAAAPVAFARDDDECPPTCTDPEPDESTPPVASITGAAAYVRTDGTVVFSAAGSTGGTDTIGDPVEISKVEWDLDGVAGYEVDSGTSLSAERSYGKGFTLGNLVVRVKVTSPSGTDTDTHTIEIQNRAPSASFTADDLTPVVGQVVTFTGTVGDADSGSVAPWWYKGSSWCDVFSDSTCFTDSFSRAFYEPGTYTIKLRAHDSDSGRTEVEKTVTVRAAPTAAIATAQDVVVAGEGVTLDASGSTGQGPLTYRWDLDGDAGNGFEVDGGQSSTRVATFAAGQRSVRVQVTDADSAVAVSAPLALTVHDAPTVSFSFAPTAPLTGQAVTFAATAQDADGIVRLEWDLDGDAGNGFEIDAGTSTSQQWTYTTPGTYTVRLRVTDGRGVQRTTSHAVTVTAPVTQGEQQPGPSQDGGGAQSQNPASEGGTPVTTTDTAAPTGTKAKKAKKRCRTVKVKRKGKTVSKRVCKKAKKAKKRSTRRK